MIKKVSFIIFKSMLIFIAIILLYILAAFIISKITIDEEPSANDEIAIYLLTNGVHSDIVVPIISDQHNWYSEIHFLKPSIDTSKYKFLALGWGDKGFYLNTPTWSELKVSTALKATVGISGTAIHATFYKDMVENENCVIIEISTEQYDRLVKYIQSSFELDDKGNFIKILTDANKGDLDAFYEANGRYNLFNTCNTWTNNGLKFSGQKACLWTAFQNPIFDKYVVLFNNHDPIPITPFIFIP